MVGMVSWDHGQRARIKNMAVFKWTTQPNLHLLFIVPNKVLTFIFGLYSNLRSACYCQRMQFDEISMQCNLRKLHNFYTHPVYSVHCRFIFGFVFRDTNVIRIKNPSLLFTRLRYIHSPIQWNCMHSWNLSVLSIASEILNNFVLSNVECQYRLI